MEPPGPGDQKHPSQRAYAATWSSKRSAPASSPFDPTARLSRPTRWPGGSLGRPRELVGVRVDDVLCAKETLRAGSASSTPGLSVPDTRHQVSVTLPDGATRALGFSTSQFVDPDSGTVHHVVLFQEITALLELRRDRDRLLQFAALGDAMPSILHEIRNPLAAVTSLLEVLVEEQEESCRRICTWCSARSGAWASACRESAGSPARCTRGASRRWITPCARPAVCSSQRPRGGGCRSRRWAAILPPIDRESSAASSSISSRTPSTPASQAATSTWTHAWRGRNSCSVCRTTARA